MKATIAAEKAARLRRIVPQPSLGQQILSRPRDRGFSATTFRTDVLQHLADLGELVDGEDWNAGQVAACSGDGFDDTFAILSVQLVGTTG